jgi:cytochrome c-type biogenesis protein CcmH
VIAFILIAAALLVGALLVVLPPLMRGGKTHGPVDQAGTALAVLREQLADLETEYAGGRLSERSYRQSRDELERRVLAEGESDPADLPAAGGRAAGGWAALVLVVVPVSALVLYFAVGNPAGLDPARVAEQQPKFTQEQVEGMVATLAARMEKEPDNVEGWTMLARSYMVMGRYAEAEKAYGHLAQRMPQSAQALADWADALAAAGGGTLTGEPEKLIARALQIDPHNMKALALAGSVAYERQDYAGASRHWEAILAGLQPDQAQLAESIRGSIAEARAKGGLPPLADAAPSPAVAAAGFKVSGEVRIDAALAAQAKPEDTVFVFLRGETGGPPFAALRFSVAQLPAKFDFTAAPAMLQGRPAPASVVVGARVSRSGNAMPSSGDLEGFSGPVAADAPGVRVSIDKMRP